MPPKLQSKIVGYKPKWNLKSIANDYKNEPKEKRVDEDGKEYMYPTWQIFLKEKSMEHREAVISRDQGAREMYKELDKRTKQRKKHRKARIEQQRKLGPKSIDGMLTRITSEFNKAVQIYQAANQALPTLRAAIAKMAPKVKKASGKSEQMLIREQKHLKDTRDALKSVASQAYANAKHAAVLERKVQLAGAGEDADIGRQRVAPKRVTATQLQREKAARKNTGKIAYARSKNEQYNSKVKAAKTTNVKAAKTEDVKKKVTKAESAAYDRAVDRRRNRALIAG